MWHNLLTHDINCSQREPCRACKSISILREKLAPEDFAAFARYAIPQGFEPTADPLGLGRAVAETFPVLTKRIENALENSEIRTLRQLVTKSEAEMLAIPGFGRKSLNELKELLTGQGLHFGWQG